MKLNTSVNLEETTSIVNPIYEAKAISFFTIIFIRIIDILGAIIGIFFLIPLIFYCMIEKIRCHKKGPLFYSQKRIGKNGNIFRMYKLNTKAPFSEFPQFINVLLGQMTLVGPRPYTISEIEKMGAYYDIIIKSKPRFNRSLSNFWKKKDYF